MIVTVSFKGKKKIRLPEKATVSDALEQAGINKFTVLVKIKNRIIPDNKPLKNKDELEIFRVVF